MARKVFISFLGTNNYKECVYTLDNRESRVVKFVQTAIIELYCKEWISNDQVIIFTTQDALTNWELLQLEWKPNVSIKNVMIPACATEKELAIMFDLVYNELQKNDELILDITHSFRSIPLITSSLLQYAKHLKQITVNGIYYGAFDAIGVKVTEIDTKIPNPADRKAPIFNLTYFSSILDWSNAANSFINFGNAKELVSLTKQQLHPVLKETKGLNKVAKELDNLNKSIEKLALILKTNRGLELIDGKEINNINNILSNLEQELIAPLNPILDQLKQSIQPLSNGVNCTKNMITAVQWCIDKQLIQEGFTLLQEGIISHLLDDYKNQKKRDFLSGLLSANADQFDPEKTGLDELDKITITSRLDKIKNLPDLKETYRNLNQYRNDINHAGIRNSPLDYNKFEALLIEYFKKINDLLNYETT